MRPDGGGVRPLVGVAIFYPMTKAGWDWLLVLEAVMLVSFGVAWFLKGTTLPCPGSPGRVRHLRRPRQPEAPLAGTDRDRGPTGGRYRPRLANPPLCPHGVVGIGQAAIRASCKRVGSGPAGPGVCAAWSPGHTAGSRAGARRRECKS
jgi:hypothetical protein